MNRKLRYSGIAAITLSLFMLSLGSMPTSESQVVGSVLNVNISCGLILANPSINWLNTLDPTSNVLLDSANPADFAGPTPTLENPVSSTANTQVVANAGATPTGGYAGTTDTTTHIEPIDMDLDLVTDASVVLPNPLSNAGADTAIGTIPPNTVDGLRLTVDTSNIVGQPITDAVWAASINISGSCAVV